MVPMRLKVASERWSRSAVEATYIEAMGIPCAVFGPGTLRNAHAMDEHVDIEEIRDAAKILVRMILDWCGTA